MRSFNFVSKLIFAAEIIRGQQASNHVILENPDGVVGQDFGAKVVSLDFDGDGKLDLAVGAPKAQQAFVFFDFKNDQNNARPPLKIMPPDGDVVSFGVSMLRLGPCESRGEDLLVCAPAHEGGSRGGGGACWTFRYNQTTQQSIIFAQYHAPRPAEKIAFGQTAAIFQEKILIGAAKEFDGVNSMNWTEGGGAFHVYSREPSCTLAFEQTINNPNSAPNGNFAQNIVATSERLLVSALGNTVNQVQYAGQQFVFDSEFNVVQVLDDPEGPEIGTRFGMHVDLSPDGKWAYVGSPRHDYDGIVDAGIAYAFDLENGNSFVQHQGDYAGHVDIENGLLGYRNIAWGNGAHIAVALKGQSSTQPGPFFYFYYNGNGSPLLVEVPAGSARPQSYEAFPAEGLLVWGDSYHANHKGRVVLTYMSGTVNPTPNTGRNTLNPTSSGFSRNPTSSSGITGSPTPAFVLASNAGKSLPTMLSACWLPMLAGGWLGFL